MKDVFIRLESHNSQDNNFHTISPALDVTDIHIKFSRGGQDLPVLNGVSLTVGQGEFVSIVGPSGCGKSTLFHIIGGLVQPDSGKVCMNGRVVTGERGHISFMPQQPALFPWRTIEDNVILAQEIKGISKKGARKGAREWIAKVGLSGFEQSYPHMLSGGMQQRAAFLRALLSPEELICLDEPFSALDALTRSDMQRWLLNIWEENRRSVLFITHNIEEALLLSNRIYVMSNRPGTVLQVVDVPLHRPRREEITDDPIFLKLKRELSQLMKEEQNKK
jgi:ABC-type nitrate/sulfonate/bicarbonate transport system ATPase subunit